jgi:hypothetical protein
MSILSEKTDLQKGMDAVDISILSVGVSVDSLACILTTQNEAILTMPIGLLLEVMNDDVERTIAVMETDSALCTAVNAHLNTLNHPKLLNRAPTKSGPDNVEFVDGKFVEKKSK